MISETRMKLAVTLPLTDGEMSRDELLEFVKAADALGYHSLWAPEAWSYDAFVLLARVAEHTERIGLATGIVNIYSRTPTLLAQSAGALDMVSGGRAILGIGTSGPQVVEGWHGLRFDRPVQRTRETIEIVRTVLRREKVAYSGEVFKLGMGLRLMNYPVRPAVPIVVASLGPRNLEMTAELADGWMPTLFSPAKAKEVFGPSLDAGRANRSADLGPLDVIPAVGVCLTDQPDGPRQYSKAPIALYVGGMGSKEQNFYNRLFRRYGYESEAAKIQELYLAKQQDEARALVTDEMVDEVSAIGDAGYLKDRFAQFAEAGTTVLLASLIAFDQRHRLSTLETLAGLV